MLPCHRKASSITNSSSAARLTADFDERLITAGVRPRESVKTCWKVRLPNCAPSSGLGRLEGFPSLTARGLEEAVFSLRLVSPSPFLKGMHLSRQGGML